MTQPTTKQIVGVGAGIVGLLLLPIGIFYDLGHFLDPQASGLLGSLVFVGYGLILLSPILLRLWWLLYLVLGMTAIFVVWFLTT